MSKPWEDVPDLWKDEKAYCAWLRSQSRRIWARHPIKNRYKAERTHVINILPYEVELRFKELFPRAKKACACELCQDYFPASKIEVDHITPAGSFTNVEEWKDWLDRLLLLGFSGIRLLCIPCHLKVTLAERFHCSLENVWVYQNIAAFNKLKAKDMDAKLYQCGITAYKKNNGTRKLAYRQFMMEYLK